MNPDPDILLREAAGLSRLIERALPKDSLGHPLEILAETTSTNDVLKERAQAGAAEGTAVLALAQTRGRGQQGRPWISPAGKGLYLSVLLRPHSQALDGGRIAALAADAVRAVLAEAGVPALTIKPPNDVLAGGRKIAGVLVEPRIGRTGCEFAVVGIGVNLKHTAGDFASLPPDRPATSCLIEGVDLSVAQAAARVLRRLTRLYRRECLPSIP